MENNMGKKILIVDDDQDMVRIITKALQFCKYEVLVAYNSRDGLNKLVEEKPDLMLLDVILENKTSGFDMVYDIRYKDSETRFKDVKDIPIIMLSAIDRQAKSNLSMQQSSMMGVNAFLSKPFEMDELIETIREFV